MITLLTNLTLLLALAGLAATPAAIVFWRRWHQAETAARANGQRADLEQLERERAEWSFTSSARSWRPCRSAGSRSTRA